MTRDETQRILAVIAATYPNFKPENKTQLVDTWHWILEEYNYQDINLALKTFVMSSQSAFAPSVSELIGLVNKANEPQYTEEGEAWAMVYKAICNSSYNSATEFAKLPEMIQKAVGSADQLREWATDTDFNHSVESSNFKRQYRQLVEKDKEYQRMPIEMKQRIEQKGMVLIGNKDM